MLIARERARFSLLAVFGGCSGGKRQIYMIFEQKTASVVAADGWGRAVDRSRAQTD